MDKNSRKPYVFLCHIPSDREILEKITAILDSVNISYVSSCETDNMAELLREVSACLVLLSSNSAASRTFCNQISAVLQFKIPVIVLWEYNSKVELDLMMQIQNVPTITIDSNLKNELFRLLPRELMARENDMIKHCCRSAAQSFEDMQDGLALERMRRMQLERMQLEQMRAEIQEPKERGAEMCPSQSTASTWGSTNMPNKKEKKRDGLFSWLTRKKQEEDPIIPTPAIDSVQFSAVSGNDFTPGTYLSVDIVMYEDAHRQVVDNLLQSKNGKAQESRSGYHQVERNARIRVELSCPDFSLDTEAEERIWKGKYVTFSFAVKVPKDYSDSELLLKAKVYINDLIATTLNLVFKNGQQVQISRVDVVSAFVSYASQDRHRVAAIVQGMKKARPDMDIFFDVESLRCGQMWEDALWAEIDRRDVLFLCWSHFAKNSIWVEREWRYALEHKGKDVIEPIPIDTPDVCPPPLELQGKHFNDKMLYIINATSPNVGNSSVF